MKYILYSEDIGGQMHCLPSIDNEDVEATFKKVLDRRMVEFRTRDKITRVAPVYVALVESLEDYDFVDNKSNTIVREVKPDKETKSAK